MDSVSRYGRLSASVLGEGRPEASDREAQRWYVVQAKPREEQRAVENLSRQGYLCYLPLRDTEKIRRRAKVVVSEPLFPGYLFVGLDRVHSDWSKIRSTRGVNRIVRFGDHYPSLSQEALDGLERCRAVLRPLFNRGDMVRITAGAFSGIEAVFVEPDGDARVILLMRMLGSEHNVSFPAFDLVPAY